MTNGKSLDRGIVYGASGLPWLLETLVSAVSARQHMPELPIDLHIDQETFQKASQLTDLNKFFDVVEAHNDFEHWRSPKFKALTSMRFDRILYLDGDTLITDRIDELFDCLDQFDIAAMPAPQRIHIKVIESGLDKVFPPVPACFTEYNGGVMSYKRSDDTRHFFSEWVRLHKLGVNVKNYQMDQAAFRVSLYYSNLRILALWPEYNLRYGVPNIVKDKVKIVHAHGNLKIIEQEVNEGAGHMRFIQANRKHFYGMVAKYGVGFKNDPTELINEFKEVASLLIEQLNYKT